MNKFFVSVSYGKKHLPNLQDRYYEETNIDDGKDKSCNENICIYRNSFCVCLYINLAYAKTVEIEMLNKDESYCKMVYSEELVHVDVDDIVKWLPTSKGQRRNRCEPRGI